MKQSVTVIDYGCGNILSVTRAFEQCGAATELSDDPSAIERAERLVLPGVGAFADGMRGLRDGGMIEPLRRYAASGRPLLGICLGMQMLASTSDEFGHHEGLGIVPGHVARIPAVDIDGTPQKIPHIGWANVVPAMDNGWAGTLLEGMPLPLAFYLVHSFHFVPDNPAHRLADCFYGGHCIAAAVRVGRTVGCQFHPEKSGPAGLRLLASFLRL